MQKRVLKVENQWIPHVSFFFLGVEVVVAVDKQLLAVRVEAVEKRAGAVGTHMVGTNAQL